MRKSDIRLLFFCGACLALVGAFIHGTFEEGPMELVEPAAPAGAFVSAEPPPELPKPGRSRKRRRWGEFAEGEHRKIDIRPVLLYIERGELSSRRAMHFEVEGAADE